MTISSIYASRVLELQATGLVSGAGAGGARLKQGGLDLKQGGREVWDPSTPPHFNHCSTQRSVVRGIM